MSAKSKPSVTRLVNVNSGAIVSVASEKVDRMGSEWEPVKAATKKSATSDQK